MRLNDRPLTAARPAVSPRRARPRKWPVCALMLAAVLGGASAAPASADPAAPAIGQITNQSDGSRLGLFQDVAQVGRKAITLPAGKWTGFRNVYWTLESRGPGTYAIRLAGPDLCLAHQPVGVTVGKCSANYPAQNWLVKAAGDGSATISPADAPDRMLARTPNGNWQYVQLRSGDSPPSTRWNVPGEIRPPEPPASATVTGLAADPATTGGDAFPAVKVTNTGQHALGPQTVRVTAGPGHSFAEPHVSQWVDGKGIVDHQCTPSTDRHTLTCDGTDLGFGPGQGGKVWAHTRVDAPAGSTVTATFGLGDPAFASGDGTVEVH
ncbi:RICIN domain-containing protein [Streptomyces sp. NPDC016845]|uniref:RICIN domain-containing protein n=1 Tax=Streptomyces sp. NPDC016845 TaxID=3364972 RepID=UPI0037A8ECDA